MSASQPHHSLPGDGVWRSAVNLILRPMWAVILFTTIVNILLLTGPIYMLNVYDRVLGARSFETLAALSILVVFLYGALSLIDLARTRTLIRIGAQFQSFLEPQILFADLSALAAGAGPPDRPVLADLTAVRTLLASPAMIALLDLPFSAFFFAVIWLFHPHLGVFAGLGAALLLLAVVLQQWHGRQTLDSAMAQARIAEERLRDLRDCVQHGGGLAQSLGLMSHQVSAKSRSSHLSVQVAEVFGAYAVVIRGLRLFLQSGTLGFGALLVLQDTMSPGAMIAASILTGRALAPIEIIVGQWSNVTGGLASWRQLAATVLATNPSAPRRRLQRPKSRVEAQDLSLCQPNSSETVVSRVRFTVEPGQALGVIGPSGVGKSTLAQALIGAKAVGSGQILIGGMSINHYVAEDLADWIGYLPQRAQLFNGTIAQNIAGFDAAATEAQIIDAAQLAGCHGLIHGLPQGFETRIGVGGIGLSGGQIQRLALSRAVYGNKVLWVLDEPEVGLDTPGLAALHQMIADGKARGVAIILMSHRPAALQLCDALVVLDHGEMQMSGPREQVMRRLMGPKSKPLRRSNSAGVT